MNYKSINYIPKIKPETLEILSLIYTPGVGHACMKIKENSGLSYVYTNRENSVAVLSFDYESSLKRAIFLKNTLNIDAYPFEVDKNNLALVVENIVPNFCGIDLNLISEAVKNIDFNSEIPILKETNINIKDFFKPFSKNIFMFDINKLYGDFKEQSLFLREKAGGVIESSLDENEQIYKPIAIISDGSAVLGFGNIGANAGLPVMEGKAVLFKSLGKVNAIPLCLKTQNPQEIIQIIKALKNSFSGINLEDISAPRCFDIEKELINTLNIPVFHDDQHGTAIVVLAALLNALYVAKKELSSIKIVISGAGAAAQAVSKLLLAAGFQNIIHTDRKGIVYKNRKGDNPYLEKLAEITNKEKIKGSLENALEKADVFIGLSTADILKPKFIKKMSENPIIFALANPTPEIMPDIAKSEGAFIVATGRSDFENQINNSLAFPGLFKGLLDYKINKITDEIKIECAMAIASLIKKENLSTTNILPKALDSSVVKAIIDRLSTIKN
jgi:malate dehydrogenase (oxaloacetate-decarboxylating)